MLDRARDARRRLLQLLTSAEGITRARDEQAGHVDVGQVLDAQPLGLARRMEWIGDEDQPGGRQPVGHRHGADAPSHRPTSEHEPVGADVRARDEAGRLLAHGGQQDGRTIGSGTARLAIGEVRPHDGQWIDGVLDGHE